MATTPVNDIEMYDHLPPEEAVVAAWTEQGKHPGWHVGMQVRMRDYMPLVARALDRLALDHHKRERRT